MKYLVGFFSLEWMRIFDFIAPLAIRLFLAPMLWVAGVQHLGLFSSPEFAVWNPLTWSNPEAFQQNVTNVGDITVLGMGAATLLTVIGVIELLSALLLILGFAVRWVTLALLFVMTVLAIIALGNADFWSSMGQLVMTHGYSNMTNNPVEMYLVYFVMLIALFFMGAGRWVSLDWFVYRHFVHKLDDKTAAGFDPFEIDATDEPGISKL